VRAYLLASALTLSCATTTAAPKPTPETPPALPTVAVCPTKAPIPFTEAGSSAGAKVEKVCLVGASEDSYLKLHELVAPREGTTLDPDAVRTDIETMFQQGLLKDVVVLAQPLASQGVMLIYVVTEYDTITSVDFSGVSVVTRDQLAELAHTGIQASPFVLKTLAETVEALYAGLGYSQAKVGFELKPVSAGKSALTLKVEEGAQVKVASISFEGAKQLGEVELRKVIKTTIGSPYLEEFAQRDVIALTTLYFDHGMVNVAIQNAARPLAVPPGAVALVFEVKEGDVFRLGKVSLTGFSLGVEKDLLKNMEAKPKSVFSRSALQRDMERLRARAQLQGHTVEIVPLTSIDAEKKVIDVAFELQKKPSGQIRF
jgi:outer membrane protein insertion porin family